MALINIDRNPYPEPISVKYSGTKGLVNGSVIGYEHGKVALEQELFDGKEVTEGCLACVVAEPFHPYLPTEEEIDMAFKSGDVVRAYPLKAGIEVTVSKDKCSTGAIKLGDYVGVKNADVVFEKVIDKEKAVGKVVKVYKFNGQDSLRILFI